MARNDLEQRPEVADLREIYERLLGEYERLLQLVGEGLEQLEELAPSGALVREQEVEAKPAFSPWSAKISVVAIAGYVVICLAFAVIWSSGSKDGVLNTWVPAIVFIGIRLGTMAVGLRMLRQHWPQTSAIVRTLWLLLCVGLAFGALGEVVWLAYNLSGVAVPYPGVPDIGFVLFSISWTAAFGLMFWALDTNIRDEVGSLFDILAVVWTFIVGFISLVNGKSLAAYPLERVALDIFYPFTWALIATFVGALLFGGKHARMPAPWRWFVGLAYLGTVVLFLGNLSYSITTSLTRTGASFGYLYYNGGPTDFLFATGEYLLALAIFVGPLRARLSARGVTSRLRSA